MEFPIDIILVTHNKMDNTIRCINALYKNTREAFKLTVIDDSTDETEAYFRRLIAEGDEINYVRPDVHLGSCSQAINIGLKLTKTDPVIFLTNSTFVEPDWLTMGIKIMEEDPLAGIVGFKILYPETNVIMEAGLHVFPDASRQNVGMYEPGHRYNHIREVNAVGWAVVLLRRAALPPEGLDESFYIPWRCVADLDFCLEVKKRGWRIYYNGMGVVYHILSASQGGGTEQGRKECAENCRRFEEKWRGKVPPIR